MAYLFKLSAFGAFFTFVKNIIIIIKSFRIENTKENMITNPKHRNVQTV